MPGPGHAAARRVRAPLARGPRAPVRGSRIEPTPTRVPHEDFARPSPRGGTRHPLEPRSTRLRALDRKRIRMPRRPSLSLALLVLALPSLATVARASAQNLSLALGVGSVYNDNFLEYSDNQLQTFKDGTHPLRFAVQSTDDGIFSPGVSLTWELDQGGGRLHAMRAHGDGDFHAHNPGADRRAWSGRWTESFAGGRRLALGYGRLDHYYVRQLRDEDLAA